VAIRNYITVSSIDAVLPKVTANGGSLVSPKDMVPGFGYCAVVKDSEGNEIGLWEELAS
jgi:predicted enzyme related to lactoylglutathione lyase